jgi:hypothetical protein
MPDENEITLQDEPEASVEELILTAEVGEQPDAVWEWNGEEWIAVAE